MQIGSCSTQQNLRHRIDIGVSIIFLPSGRRFGQDKMIASIRTFKPSSVCPSEVDGAEQKCRGGNVFGRGDLCFLWNHLVVIVRATNRIKTPQPKSSNRKRKSQKGEKRKSHLEESTVLEIYVFH